MNYFVSYFSSNKCTKVYALLATLLLSIPAEAQGIDALLHNVAVFDKEKRFTFEEYASQKKIPLTDLEKRFAATGNIRCGEHQASAQLTGAADILTTSAHLLFSPTCVPKTEVGPANKCIFLATVNGDRRTFDVKERLASGCDNKIGQEHKWGDDWLIVQLRSPVSGAKPYRIPVKGDVHIDEEPVVAIEGASRDFFRFSNGKKTYPRSVQECRVRFIREASGEGSYVETDCDGAPLASGSSLLRDTRKGDTLLGIFRGNFEFSDALEKALRENRVNRREWEQGAWSSIYVSVDGKFLKALEDILRAKGLTDFYGAKGTFVTPLPPPSNYRE